MGKWMLNRLAVSTVFGVLCLLLTAQQTRGQDDSVQGVLLTKMAELDNNYIPFDPEQSEIIYSHVGQVRTAIEMTVQKILYESDKTEVTRLKKRLPKFKRFLDSNQKLHSQFLPIRTACSEVYSTLQATRNAPKGSIADAHKVKAEKAAQVCMKNFALLQVKIDKHEKEWEAIDSDVREAIGLSPRARQEN